MLKEYIITMTAANRVGILAAVTKAMTELGGDLREASQTVVRGFFTMIFSAEFPEDMSASVIVDHLQDTCRPFGIEVSVREADPGQAANADKAAVKHYSLRLGGDNQKGVLKELSSTISMRRVDIAGMHAIRTKNGAGFEMVMKIATPKEFDIDGLIDQINQIGKPFNMTAELSDYS